MMKNVVRYEVILYFSGCVAVKSLWSDKTDKVMMDDSPVNITKMKLTINYVTWKSKFTTLLAVGYVSTIHTQFSHCFSACKETKALLECFLIQKWFYIDTSFILY